MINLRAMGHSVLLVSPDPIAFVTQELDSDDPVRSMAARLARIERNLMINRMLEARIHVLDWDITNPLERAIHISFYRTIPEPTMARLNL